MASDLLDTNVIIRYLTQDNLDQAERAARLLRLVEAGSLEVTTLEGVLVEAVQILSSRRLYNLPRAAIRQGLGSIISLRGVKVAGNRKLLRALDIFAHRKIHFVDALIISHVEARRGTSVISFDRDFDRFDTVERREP